MQRALVAHHVPQVFGPDAHGLGIGIDHVEHFLERIDRDDVDRAVGEVFPEIDPVRRMRNQDGTLVVLAADHGVEIVGEAQGIDLALELAVIMLGLGRDHLRKRQHRLVGFLAQLFQLLDGLVISAAHHVNQPAGRAGNLVAGGEIGRQTPADVDHRLLALQRLGTDDACRTLGIEADQLDPRLDIFGDMLDAGEAAPGTDLFNVVRLVDLRFQCLVTASPIGHREVLGDRVIGRHVDHSAGNRPGGERIVGGHLDNHVAARHRTADHRQCAQHRAIARDDMQLARAIGADADGAAVELLFDPAFEMIDADVEIDHLPDPRTIKHEGQVVEKAVHDRLGRRCCVVGIF